MTAFIIGSVFGILGVVMLYMAIKYHRYACNQQNPYLSRTLNGELSSFFTNLGLLVYAFGSFTMLTAGALPW